jgi:hypothetical protein
VGVARQYRGARGKRAHRQVAVSVQAATDVASRTARTRRPRRSHEWAKRQAATAGVGYTALDNGFATCADPAALQALRNRLDPTQIQADVPP